MSHAAAAWFLLAVYGDGHIVTSQFPTHHLCLEGQSEVRYGMTLTEKVDADAVAAIQAKLDAARAARLEADFSKSHPCQISGAEMLCSRYEGWTDI